MGFYACSKCVIEGETKKNTYFAEENCDKRTNESFRHRLQPEHHIGTSSIELCPNFDLIENIPLDYMHLICLGVVKKLLAHNKYGFVFGKPPYKLQAAHIIKINNRLRKCRNFIPAEFSRKTRNISECKRYKATEFRTFLLYVVWPVVLKGILPIQKYNNFLVLSVAICILISKRVYNMVWVQYAKNLIQHFLTSCKNIYGAGFFSLNVHSLTHLVDCCIKFGPLDNFSAFPFENVMQKLLKQVRKANQPLQQVIRRHSKEYNMINTPSFLKNNFPQGALTYSQIHFDGPLIADCKNPQYKKIIVNSFTLSCNTFANRVVQLKNGLIFEVINFCYNNLNELVMVGKPYNKIKDFFKKEIIKCGQLSFFKMIIV